MINLSANDMAAGLRTYLRIMHAWSVKDRQAMGILGATEMAYNRWRKNPETARLSQAQLDRMSFIFGIYKRLQVLLPDTQVADLWVSTPNAADVFGGLSPLDLMGSGNLEDLRRVRDYLEAEM